MRRIVLVICAAIGFEISPVGAQTYVYFPGYGHLPAQEYWVYFLATKSAGTPIDQPQPAEVVPPITRRPEERWWVDAEFLLWWMRNSNLPPLVTTSPQASLGILGQPGTRVLFGGDTSSGVMPGVRFNVGHWDDACQKRGCEVNLLYIPGNAGESFSSNGNPLLARPFFDVTLGMQSSQLVANDDSAGAIPLTGTVGVSLDSQLWSPEFNRICNLCLDNCGRYRWDFLYGVRYLQFEEDLAITENLRVPDDAPDAAGVRFDITDRFRTRNQFLGPQFGVRGEWRQRSWRLEATGKVAVGAMHQTVSIDGQTITTDPGVGVSVDEGGLLALPSNIGRYHRTNFVVIPELNLKAAWMWNSRLQTYLGYNALFISNVVRPGEHIDLRVNPTQLPNAPVPFSGPALPAFRFEGTEFWIHGVSAGLVFSF